MTHRKCTSTSSYGLSSSIGQAIGIPVISRVINYSTSFLSFFLSFFRVSSRSAVQMSHASRKGHLCSTKCSLLHCPDARHGVCWQIISGSTWSDEEASPKKILTSCSPLQLIWGDRGRSFLKHETTAFEQKMSGCLCYWTYNPIVTLIKD